MKENKRINCEKCHYFADIVVEDKKTIIEYNGRYWHCDPRFYDASYFNTRKQMYADEIWKKDRNRIQDLMILGYNVIIIWEDEYNSKKYLQTLKEKMELIERKLT